LGSAAWAMPANRRLTRASRLRSFAGIAQAAEPKQRQFLHRLIIGLGHRKDCWIGWLKGLSRPVIGSAVRRLSTAFRTAASSSSTSGGRDLNVMSCHAFGSGSGPSS